MNHVFQNLAEAQTESLRQFRTSSGTVYCISRGGRYAWPLRGPIGYHGIYDTDCARAVGLEVDAYLPRDDYRVHGAGPDWLEVYEHLKETQ